MPANNSAPKAYEIKIILKDTHPPVWRRVQASSGTTLYDFHKIIQAVMGWQNYHLHKFTVQGQYYGDPADDEYGDFGIIDEAFVKLQDVIPEPGFKFEYEYDFGDSWEHEIKVEKTLQLEKPLRRPVCIDGKRACPPEDVGGVYMFEHFLEAIRNRKHEEHDRYLEWVGGEFDPAFFDLELANEHLKHINDMAIIDEPAFSPFQSTESNPQGALARWTKQLDDNQIAWAENLALRRDMVTLLKYLQANKVTGTSARGNFTLKAVREITVQFVHPPKLEETIGSLTIRFRSEEEVWPIYLLHILGVASGLIEGGQSKKWRVTDAGKDFLDAPAPVQAWILFSTWWLAINWLVEFNWGALDQYLPEGYKNHCREVLLSLPSGEPVAFEGFANHLIDVAGLSWPTVKPEDLEGVVNDFVEQTLIHPLVDFELIVPEYEGDGKKYSIPVLVAFQLNSVTKKLLEDLRKAGL